MNVDTGAFTALAEQAARLEELGDRVTGLMRAAEILYVAGLADGRISGVGPPAAASPAGGAPPRLLRPLRVIPGGKR